MNVVLVSRGLLSSGVNVVLIQLKMKTFATVYDGAYPFVLIFFGCCTAMIFFEKALKADPGSSNFLTFTELVFICCETLPSRVSYNGFKPLIAKWQHHFLH